MVALVRNENEGLVKFKDPTMVCRLFAVNPGRGRGRNYVNLLFSVFHLATVGYCVFYCPWTYQCFICCWRRLAVSVVTYNNRNMSSDPAGILWARPISHSFFSREILLGSATSCIENASIGRRRNQAAPHGGTTRGRTGS